MSAPKMFSSAVSTSMARVSNLFSRNEMYQEQTDLFNDDQIWTGPSEKNDRPTMVGDKPQPWSRTEAETQAANVKALLQDQLRREKPLAEVVGDSPLERSPPEKSCSRRKESGSNPAAAFDFPQDWLTPQTSPAQRSAERAERIDAPWPVTSTSRSPSQARAWPVTEPRSQEMPTLEPCTTKERNVGRQESLASAAGQFDEAILAALSALPRHSLVDVLRRLADRRPEEVAAALHLKDPSPASTGAGTALLSPPKSEVTRGTTSPASALSPSPQMAVAEAVAEAADAAAGSGWPDPSDVWPSVPALRPDPWPQVTQVAWPEANR